MIFITAPMMGIYNADTSGIIRYTEATMNCIYCKNCVGLDRYEFLVETGRKIICKDCSVENRAVGFMDWGHKTAPSLVLVPSNATETIRKLDRANRRAR
jgi:hypothetical protein